MPDDIKRFLTARIREGAGLALALAALALALALLSYSARDQSLGTAATGPLANWMGAPGAIVADLLVQSVGLSAFLLVAPLLLWGARMMRQESPASRAELLALLAALPGACLALAAFSGEERLDHPAGLGGLLGHALYAGPVRGLLDLTHVGPGLGSAALAAAAGLLVCLPFYLWSLGLGLADAPRAVGRLTGGLAAVRERMGGLGLPGLPPLPALRLPSALARLVPDRRRDEAVDGDRDPPFDPDADEGADDPATDEDGEDPLALRPGREGGLAARPAPPVRRAGGAKGPRPSRREAKEAEPLLDLEPGLYQLPPLGLLAKPRAYQSTGEHTDEALQQNARLLETVLGDFGVRGQITEVRPGPVVTLYEFEPAPGVKSSRVIGLADDIARSMSAISARVAVIPGRNVLGIELPNARREVVYLRELLSAEDYERTGSRLALALGKDISGAPVIADLAAMPHLLIAGTTGSGKSVAVNAMILSLLYRLPPEECRLIMIDPKMLELSVYDGIPHLLTPVVTDPKKAVVALKWVVREMEDRYRKMSKVGVRNVKGFNVRVAEAREKDETLTRTVQTGFDRETGEPIYETEEMPLEPMPYIVVIVDEMADLMMVAGKDIEAAVQRLAQMARAAGIHLLTATQRPSVDVITGTIKANFPTRISFQVTSKIDSRTILGEQGAEQLLGQGDMLFMQGGGRIKRVHGPFVSDKEVEDVVAFLKGQGEPAYVASITEEPDEDGFGMFMAEQGGGDDLYDRAVAIVARDRKASTSYVQRKLQIGYNRAARLMEQMEEQGVVSPPNHSGKREVLVGDHSD
ncbi:MAG: DNA translocase FtsK 4TM domain-containing protein [Alphaproteobacteria bacterium]|nr:DNA translocase FtsK 4TM domain-containing protein [Alphaproteobacteria bacterium]